MLGKHHPIAHLLNEAANGVRPTRASLDAALAQRPRDVPGVDLAAHREEVTIAAEEVATIAGASDYVNQKRAALDRAAEHSKYFESVLSEDERNVVLYGSEMDLDDIDYDTLARGA